MLSYSGDWTIRFFQPAIFTPGSREAVAAAPRETAFLWKALGLRRGSLALDVACGTGRHAVLLARRGARVTGVDVTSSYLREARKKARGGLRFLRADMRRLPFETRFDAAYCVWTSFGYFRDPADDLRALRAMAKAVTPGGRVLIDVIDGAWLKKNFRQRQSIAYPDGTRQTDETELVEGKDPAVRTVWTIVRPGGKPRAALSIVRLYDEKRLTALFEKAGLTVVRRWRSLDGRKNGGRLVLLGVKAQQLKAARR